MIPPFIPPQKPPRPPFVKRGFHMVCSVCNMAQAYCRCDAQRPDAPAQDGAESGLAQRIAEARMKAGGR